MKVAGFEPGQRRLNGPQTSGREYRALSPAEWEIEVHTDVAIPMRDGTTLLADVYRPKGDGRFPALVSASPYPRHIQNSGAPMGFVEAGATDFFVPRGYAHVIVNSRGTNGSGGEPELFGTRERADGYDTVEWVAAQPWCDANVGMIGISAFAMAQLAAACEQPPHLRAIMPLAVSADTYEAFWHGGLLSQTFTLHWLRAAGLFANLGDGLLRGRLVALAEKVLRSPAVHDRFAHHNGESALALFDLVAKKAPPPEWAALIAAMAVDHPLKDAFWDERDSVARLARVRVPTYLGCDWENVPMHLPSTFASLRALPPDVPVRMTMLGRFGLTWPWESLHVEALAWFDHWLKGRETGIMDGPPIRYVLPGDESGAWRTATAWPPVESVAVGFALRADGALDAQEGAAGVRRCLAAPPERDDVRVDPRDDGASLVWTSAPLEDDLDVVGRLEVALDAALSGGDAAFILALADVAPDGTAVDVTAGWRRAAVSDDQRSYQVVPPGEVRRYAIPLVDNARRFARGHRLRLELRTDDATGPAPIMGFRHQAPGVVSRVTVASSSRLTVSVLPR